MPIANTLARVTVLLALLGCGAVAFAAPNAAECVTKTDIKSLDETFWKHYPSTDAFTRYAAPDMKIASNVADVANINETQKTGPARAGQLASFFADHPEYFGSFKTAHDATFLYYPGRDRHPDALKTVSTYPAGQCVSMFHYDLAQSQCTAGQRVRALRLSFVKEAGKLTLRVVQVAMEACP